MNLQTQNNFFRLSFLFFSTSMSYQHHYNPSTIYALASGGYRHGDDDDNGHGHGHKHGGCGNNRKSVNQQAPNACCHETAEAAPCPCPHPCANECAEAQAPPQVCCHPAAFHRTRDTIAGRRGVYHNIHVAYGTTRAAY